MVMNFWLERRKESIVELNADKMMLYLKLYNSDLVAGKHLEINECL